MRNNLFYVANHTPWLLEWYKFLNRYKYYKYFVIISEQKRQIFVAQSHKIYMTITFDIICYIVLCISTVMGMYRGLTKEMLSLFTWTFSAFIAYQCAPFLAPLLHKTCIKMNARWDQFWTLIAVHALCFIGSFLLCSFISRTLAKGIKKSALSFLDRLLGLVFGILRAGVVAVGVYIVMMFVCPLEQYPKQWPPSFLFYMAQDGAAWCMHRAPALCGYLPPHMRKHAICMIERSQEQEREKFRGVDEC